MVAQEGSPIQFTMNPYGFYLVIDTYYLFFFFFFFGSIVHMGYITRGSPLVSSKPVFFLSGIWTLLMEFELANIHNIYSLCPI